MFVPGIFKKQKISDSTDVHICSDLKAAWFAQPTFDVSFGAVVQLRTGTLFGKWAKLSKNFRVRFVWGFKPVDKTC